MRVLDYLQILVMSDVETSGPLSCNPGSDFLRASLVAQVGKEFACNAGHMGSIPGWGRSPREGNENPLQYSCLGNPMDRGA